MTTVSISPDLCKRCSICVLSCPLNIFIQEREKTVPVVGRVENCFLCGHCAALCPTGAISHQGFPKGSIRTVDAMKLPSLEQIRAMIRSRRSIRAFHDKPVEKELIEKIIDGARFAPSGMNQQTTEYIVITDKIVLQTIKDLPYRFFSLVVKLLRNPIIRTVASFTGKEAKGVIRIFGDLEQIIDTCEKGIDSILHNAPVLIIFHGEDGFAFSDINAALALHNASLVCMGAGLGCFISGLVIPVCQKNRKLSKLIGIPKGHKVFGALVIGYPRFFYKNWIERKPPSIKWV